MSLPKSLTTVTTFSKILAALLFILFPLIGFQFGMLYQKSINGISSDVKFEEKKKIILKLTPTPSPISSPSKIGWNRYMSKSLDYYIDYPKIYLCGNDNELSVSFEKKVNYPHRTNYWVFIDKGVSPQFSQTKIDELKQMGVGEVKVIMKKESSLPSQFKTYERLPDTYFGVKKAMSFVNKDVWEAGEGTYLYTYIYEGRDTYIFGGLTNESKDSEDNISYSEFKDIISTLRFLD
jgi:hypothetical protein